NIFSTDEWKQKTEQQQQEILMQYRLAYLAESVVNWCEVLGTVLANDEVVNGLSQRGGHPVFKKKMKQWFLRITEYADRLLEGLKKVEFSNSMKEMQRNWIGKSYGAELYFNINNHTEKLHVFTTRPDTIFGVDFIVLAPEHSLIKTIVTDTQKLEIEKYLQYVQTRNERERLADSKQTTGVFTGAYAIHPFTKKKIPIWTSEYVIAHYGTGAIMAVPCGDERDHFFAQYFKIPITNIFGTLYNGQNACVEKTAILENSAILSGKKAEEAINIILEEIQKRGIGKVKINYKMRDAGFSRQRYWGEPLPVLYKKNIPYAMDEQQLPLQLPHVEKYKPGPEGKGPLENLVDWIHIDQDTHRESNTMPGYAGSSWYFLRYMDNKNDKVFCERKMSDYWNQVDLYVGGTEHAIGHLLYSRLWTKVLYDLEEIGFDEPFKKLLNQGMIQGRSRFVYRKKGTNVFVSYGLKNNYDINELHVDVSLVDGVELNIEKFKQWRAEYHNAEFILEDGKYKCGSEVEKMSKSKYNTVNPNDIIEQYGADTFRMYEMFLGPIQLSKPWDMKGIEGVHRFLKKLWRLFYDDINSKPLWNDEIPTDEEYKLLYILLKKIKHDTENFSFNTAVSSFMIAVNELSTLKCSKRAILEKLLITLSPYTPHIAQQLWHDMGHNNFVMFSTYPTIEEKYLLESTKIYPIAINGKRRINMEFNLNASQEKIEKTVLGNEVVQKWLQGKTPKKLIYVKGRMINIVV
ncbi:MAG: leucine--tRNA ligase, partial [Chitinophagaceae bacterium]